MRPLLRTLLILVGGLGAVAGDAGQSMDPANRMLEEGRLEEAEEAFRELLVTYPGLIEAYDGLVTAIERQGRRGEALRLLLEAGQGLVRAGELEPGTRFLERAVALNGELPSAHAALGHAYLQAQRFGEAEAHLRRSLDLGETSPMARLFLAAAHWELGDYDAAKAAYSELLGSAGPSAAAARRSLGALLVFRGEFDAAVPLLASALGESPDSVQVRYDLARAFEGAERIPEATEVYESILADAPDFLQAHYRLARIYRREGDTDRTKRHMARFSALHAEHQELTREEGRLAARLNRGWALLREDEAEAARELFESLPPGPEALRGLAEAQYRCGDRDTAIRTIERLLDTDPERLDLRLLLDEWRVESASR